jgi:hypothetical protein
MHASASIRPAGSEPCPKDGPPSPGPQHDHLDHRTTMPARIVTSTYRYKRPPRKRKPVLLDVPAIITKRRLLPDAGRRQSLRPTMIGRLSRLSGGREEVGDRHGSQQARAPTESRAGDQP